MGAPVTCVIVPIVTAISALVRLRLDVHVHPVVVHSHPAHESFSTVFAVEPLVGVCHVHPLHMVFHIFHNHPTDFTRSRAVHLPLVQLQVSIFEHLSTIRTRHHHSLVRNLSVVVQLVGVVSLEATRVAHVLFCVLGHVFLQRLLGFTTDQTAILFTGQPSFMLDPDVPLFVLPVNVALSHLAKPCSEPWHIRALTVPSLNLVPELVLLQLCLACVPILGLVWELLPTVRTEEFLSRRLPLLLLLLLLVVLVNVFHNLFLGLSDKKAFLAGFLVGFLAAHPTLVLNPYVLLLRQKVPPHPILGLSGKFQSRIRAVA